MTTDPHTDWGDVDPARVAALLNPLKEWDAMTPEERAEASGPHRRDVLGSFEETTELNRSERGNADHLAIIGFAVAMFGLTLSFAHPKLALYLIVFVVAWVLVSLVPAVLIGRRIAGGRR